MTTTSAQPPETLEGWFALHQIFRFRNNQSRPSQSELTTATNRTLDALDNLVAASGAANKENSAGWSAFAALIGSTADVMAIHFRESLDSLGLAQDCVARTEFADRVENVYSFLSVTEAGLYHLSAEIARAAKERGGAAGDDEYLKTMSVRSSKERENPHVRRRLYPELPADLNYVCFYPMSKRRAAGQNWYSLTLDERSQLMQAHGVTGRRYAGRVQQIITGAIGLDAWEWGVTLFAKDPLDFKKLVTDMRFDEVSANYADFGDFYVGKVIPR